MGSPWTRDGTHVPCTGRWILKHCTTGGSPAASSFIFLPINQLFSCNLGTLIQLNCKELLQCPKLSAQDDLLGTQTSQKLYSQYSGNLRKLNGLHSPPLSCYAPPLNSSLAAWTISSSFQWASLGFSWLFLLLSCHHLSISWASCSCNAGHRTTGVSLLSSWSLILCCGSQPPKGPPNDQCLLWFTTLCSLPTQGSGPACVINRGWQR